MCVHCWKYAYACVHKRIIIHYDQELICMGAHENWAPILLFFIFLFFFLQWIFIFRGNPQELINIALRSSLLRNSWVRNKIFFPTAEIYRYLWLDLRFLSKSFWNRQLLFSNNIVLLSSTLCHSIQAIYIKLNIK